MAPLPLGIANRDRVADQVRRCGTLYEAMKSDTNGKGVGIVGLNVSIAVSTSTLRTCQRIV
jgi:hypothetical protein